MLKLHVAIPSSEIAIATQDLIVAIQKVDHLASYITCLQGEGLHDCVDQSN